MEYELYHYGVPGMRWGVRRDTRILANHRRNVEVKQLKNQRRSGLITREQYKYRVKNANLQKKRYLTDVKTQFKSLKNEAERAKFEEKITKTVVREVPNIAVKRGVSVVNQLIGGVSAGTAAYTAVGMAVINPAFAAAYVGAGAVAVAAEAGRSYMARALLDKTS